jgi:hypothetical protein
MLEEHEYVGKYYSYTGQLKKGDDNGNEKEDTTEEKERRERESKGYLKVLPFALGSFI